MTGSGVKGSEPDPDFYEGEVEVPWEMTASCLGFWPVREALDPSFSDNERLKFARFILTSPSANIDELQKAASMEAAARAPARGQHPEDLRLRLMRAELVLSVYAWWGRSGGHQTLEAILADYGFSDDKTLNLWARWRKAVPVELRQRSKKEGRVVTFISRSRPLDPTERQARYAAIEEGTRRTVRLPA